MVTARLVSAITALVVLAGAPCVLLADEPPLTASDSGASDAESVDPAPIDPAATLNEARAYVAQVCACEGREECIAALEARGLELVTEVWATVGGDLSDELNAVSDDLRACAPPLWQMLSEAAEKAAQDALLERFEALGGPAACSSFLSAKERFGLPAVGDESECEANLAQVIELCGEERAKRVYSCLAAVDAVDKDAWSDAVGACTDFCL